jgi:hypothetical protein
MNLKKIGLVSIVITTLLVPTFAHATGVDEQFVAPTITTNGQQGYVADETAFLASQGSYFINYQTSGNQVTAVTACTSASDSACPFTVKQAYNALLPICASDADVDCISGVTAKDANGNALDIQQNGQYPTRRLQDFTGDSSQHVPNGGGAALMTIPGATHAGGNQYLLKVSILSNRVTANGGKWDNRELQAAFYAIKPTTGNFNDLTVDTNTAAYDSINRLSMRGNTAFPSPPQPQTLCVVVSQNECGLAYPMPAGISLGFSLRLSAPITGWLHGRMKSPTITLTSGANGTQNLTVDAQPIQVPVVATWVASDLLPQKLQNFYATNPWVGQTLRFTNDTSVAMGAPVSDFEKTPAGQKTISYQHIAAQFNADAMTEFVDWLPVVGDKASANPWLWTLNSMNAGGGTDNVAKCLNDSSGLAGVVTTNATMYIDGPPQFDKKQGVLNYKVASTHFQPDGSTLNKGTYDLVMSSKVARCIYGFTSAPVSATVSVTSADGSPDIATTVVGERNGWLSLGAYNFTYSNPNIAVKLMQSGTGKSTAKSITCVKGTSTKAVTTATCPAGYKKR